MKRFLIFAILFALTACSANYPTQVAPKPVQTTSVQEVELPDWNGVKPNIEVAFNVVVVTYANPKGDIMSKGFNFAEFNKGGGTVKYVPVPGKGAEYETVTLPCWNGVKPDVRVSSLNAVVVTYVNPKGDVMSKGFNFDELSKGGGTVRYVPTSCEEQ